MRKETVTITDKAMERYSDFIARNGKNYTDKDKIIKTYNDSIEWYGRFRRAVRDSSFNEAAENLTNASMRLAADIEWAGRFLLFNYYNRKIRINPNHANVEIWELFCEGKMKRSDGKTKNMTVYDLYDHIQRPYSKEISECGLSFNVLKNGVIRNMLINGYKHEGSQPDASAFLSAANEFCALLRGLVVIDDSERRKIKGITDIYENAWESLISSCDYFKPGGARHYILLTEDIDDEHIVRDIFKISWDMVLDLSVKSDKEYDLYDRYEQLGNRREAIKKYLCDYRSIDRLPATLQTYWIKINGKANTSKKSEQVLDDDALSRQYIAHKFRDVVASFQGEYVFSVDLIIVGGTHYHKSIMRMLQAFDEQYHSEGNLHIHLLNNDMADISNHISTGFFINPDICTSYDLTINDFAQMIRINVGEYNNVGDQRYYIPSTTESSSLTEDEYIAMKQCMELIYIGVEKQYESATKDTRIKGFLMGDQRADWDFIESEDCILPQPKEYEYRDEIISAIKGGNRRLIRFKYQAGLGGTTFMRRLAFLLHNSYPTVICSRYIEGIIVDYLLKIYKKSNKGVAILVDSNDLSLTEVNKLNNELFGQTDFTFCIVYIVRQGISDERSSGELLRMNYAQCLKMQDILTPYIYNDKCRENLNACVNRAQIEQRNEEDIPFVFSMYAFDEDFHGIDSYVQHSLAEIDEQQKEIIFVLALAGYANYHVSAQYFQNLYGRNVMLQMSAGQYALAPLIRVINDFTQKKRAFQIKYYMFAEEILKWFSDSKSINISFLIDRIIHMIVSSRTDIYTEPDEEIISLFNKLFVERFLGNQNGDLLSTKEYYSPLIRKLIDESRRGKVNKYDASEDAVVSIFEALNETYPDQPHFAGHLARYYFYTRHDYEKGVDLIDDALSRAEQIEGYSLGSLYHIKAMGYSMHITNEYIKNIRDAIAHYNYSNDNEYDIDKIRHALINLADKYAKARDNYDIARSEISCRFYSNIAECELGNRIQGCYNELKQFCEGQGIPLFVTQEQQMALYDQINSMIEDCDSMLQGNQAENKENSRLLEKIKNDVLLNQAQGEEIEEVCRQIISEGKSESIHTARRILSRLYLHDTENDIYTSENQYKLQEIVRMMEDNFDEDARNNANFRIWFKALRGLDSENPLAELHSVLQKLDRWTDTPGVAKDAFYYKYIVCFIIADESGTLENDSQVQRDLNDILLDMKNSGEGEQRRPIVFDWYTNMGTGLHHLVSNSDLNMMDKNNAMNTLKMYTGELPDKSAFGGKRANIRFGSHQVYFNPATISGIITANDENKYVEFGLGFSYEGLRAYHDSIHLMKGGLKAAKKITPEKGMEVNIRIIREMGDYIVSEIEDSDKIRCDIRKDRCQCLGVSDATEVKEGQVYKVRLYNSKLISGKTIWNPDYNYYSLNTMKKNTEIGTSLGDLMKTISLNKD